MSQMRRRTRSAACAAILLAPTLALLAEEGATAPPPPEAPPPAADQNLSLSALLELKVGSAGFFPIAISKAPGRVWVIDDQKIDRLPVKSIEDILTYHTPGLHVGWHHYQGPLVGTRGVAIESNSKTLVLWNGQNLNQRTHWGYYAGLTLPLLGDLKRVEVIQGPGAIVFGSGAINGLINLVPKSGTDDQGGRIKAVYGFNDKMIGAEAGRGFVVDEDQDWYLYAGAVQADGESTETAFYDSKTGDHAYSFEPSGRLSLSGRIAGKAGTVNIQALVQRTVVDANVDTGTAASFTYGQPGVPDSAVNPNARGWSQYMGQDIAALRVGYSVPVGTKSNLEISTPMELYQNRHDRVQRSGREGEAGSSEGHIEGRAVMRTTWADKQYLALGTSYGWRRFLPGKEVIGGGAGDGNFESMDSYWTETAVFAEQVSELGEAWTISAGLRYDMISYAEIDSIPSNQVGPVVPYDPGIMSNLSPRIAVAWNPVKPWTFKASYQRGFRTPDINSWMNLSRIASRMPAGSAPRPELEPETMDSVEAGTTFETPDKLWSTTLTGYWNKYNKMLVHKNFTAAELGLTAAQFTALGTPQGHQINAADPFESIGAEIEVNCQPASWLKGDVSYGISRPLSLPAAENVIVGQGNGGDGDRWSRYPMNLIKADATVSFLRSWETTGAILWSSPINVRGSTTGNTTQANYDLYDTHRTVVNAKLRYFGAAGWIASLTAQNAFANERPAMSNGSTTNGKTGNTVRLVYADLTWEF